VTVFRTFSAFIIAVVAALPLHAQRSSQAGRGAQPAPVRSAALSPALRQQLIAAADRGAEFLKQQQQPDGRWEKHPGITALVAAAILRQPGAPHEKQLETVKRALDSLVSLQKPDGGIYERDLPDYITSVSIMALVAGGRAADKPVIEKARQFLVGQQLDEGEGVKPDDKFYGGMGYGGTTTRDGGRGDMVSLEYGLRAMKEAGLPSDNPAWQKAIKFLQRAQNNSETNDQSWAGTDGGFVYYPGFSFSPLGELHSYGSVSYAGLLSYTYANLKRDDPRVQAVLKWIRDNYTVDENPGLGQKTVYYYYMVFAKALQAVGEATIGDAKGQRHNWREELARKLIALQHPEGYWVNSVPDEMQNNKVVVTAFTMSAIEAILK
jgi:squalene-hopene/tetraprenyl-beta-curcumene cyclase